MKMSIWGSGLASAAASASTVPLPLSLANDSVTINGIPTPVFYVSDGEVDVQIPFETPSNGVATLVLNNNGSTATASMNMSAAAPGIFTDQNGLLIRNPSAAAGQVIAVYITGQGALSPPLATGSGPAPGAPSPVPAQAVSVSVGGTSAFIQQVWIPSGGVGFTEIDIQVPSGLPTGAQPVVVTVGAASSPPATLNIQ
jgi:uncharacterized protein (TIGR03437 family)